MCTYRQNTTIFIISILTIYYIRHNYMFRPLMLAIFRLNMKLSSSYTTYVGCFLGCGDRGFFVGPRYLLCQWWVHGLERYHQLSMPLFQLCLEWGSLYYLSILSYTMVSMCQVYDATALFLQFFSIFTQIIVSIYCLSFTFFHLGRYSMVCICL